MKSVREYGDSAIFDYTLKFDGVRLESLKVNEQEIRKIRDVLKNEKPYHLQHDLKSAPEWIRRLLWPVVTALSNE